MATILVVDDDLTILTLFRFIFEDAGHKVTLAANGKLALDTLRDGVPDFMVLDVAMPVMSGQEFIREYMRLAEKDARLGNIPFIVMTASNCWDKEANEVFSSTPGFVCFFPKMTPPERVFEKAMEVLKDRQG